MASMPQSAPPSNRIGRLLPARRLRRLRRLPLLSPRGWVRRLAFWLGAVLVGLAAIGFAAAADAAGEMFLHVVGPRPWLALGVLPLGLALSALLTRRLFPGAQGSGVPQVIAALHMTRPEPVAQVLSLRIAVGKVVLTLLGLGCGASIGREGPTVQVGATLMHALGRLLNLPRPDAQRALVLAGGAAGVAAAFNTPLAGVVFAIEELSHSFETRASGMVLTTVIIAGATSLGLVGNYTYFGTSTASITAGGALLAVPLCGIVGGVVGGLFSAALIHAARGLPGWAGRLVVRHPILFAGLCGVMLAALGLASGGATYGTGYAQARDLLAGQDGLPGSFFVLKLLATLVSYLSGIPGGIFAPSLSVGAGLGRLLSLGTTELMPGIPAGTVVLLGMAGYFAGVVQAPITAAVIVMEMTGNRGATIPLMATCLLGYAASRLVCRRPLYGTLARRFLIAAERRHTPAETSATPPP